MQINQEIVKLELHKLIRTLLALPETQTISIADVQIDKMETALNEKLHRAVQQSYHDCYSDVDLHITADSSSLEPAMRANYVQNFSRFGFDTDCILGAMVSQSNVCRIALKNGMRYDMVFNFIPCDQTESKPDFFAQQLWSQENVNRFWFVQLQALGKLYRKDFLISMHLANTNLNETLVQQMVLRDKQYGTTHHRYGHQEDIAYLHHAGQCPIQTGNTRFNTIADSIWCAALTYDDLMQQFDPCYQPRNLSFLDIWKCYEQNRLNAE